MTAWMKKAFEGADRDLELKSGVLGGRVHPAATERRCG
jgi:hypothetical protein